jgi:hypothetical protein
MTMALEGGEGSASGPGRSLPPGKIRYPLYRRLDGSQCRSGQVRKISPPTGIRSPDLPARSQSLYRLRYPAHLHYKYLYFNGIQGDSGGKVNILGGDSTGHCDLKVPVDMFVILSGTEIELLEYTETKDLWMVIKKG